MYWSRWGWQKDYEDISCCLAPCKLPPDVGTWWSLRQGGSETYRASDGVGLAFILLSKLIGLKFTTVEVPRSRYTHPSQVEKLVGHYTIAMALNMFINTSGLIATDLVWLPPSYLYFNALCGGIGASGIWCM